MFDPKIFDKLTEIFGYFPSSDRMAELLMMLGMIKLIVLLYFIVFFISRVIRRLIHKSIKSSSSIALSAVEGITALFSIIVLFLTFSEANPGHYFAAILVNGLAVIILLIFSIFKGDEKQTTILQNAFLIALLGMSMGIFG